MNKILKSVLVVGSLSLLGAACVKGADTNVNTTQNSNVGVNTNSVVNTNVSANVNTGVNTNAETNTNTSTIDTSDWQTYTNPDYGFSFKYPGDWKIKEDENYVGVYDPETFILANQPNTTDIVANLSVNLFSNSDRASFVQNNDVLQSLQEAESKGYINHLVNMGSGEYSFIDHNAYFDEDEIVYYFEQDKKLISLTFFYNNNLSINQSIAKTFTFR